MNRRDAKRLLRALGQQPAPGPTEDFIESLAARMRTAPRRRPRPALRRSLALAGAAIAAAVVAGFGVRSWDDSLRLSSATDATIEFPDGSVATDPAGTELPDGTVVRTGPSGRVEAGGEVLGPNREAQVRQGRLVERPTAAPTRPAPEPTPPTRPRPTPFAGPVDTPPSKQTPTPGPDELTLACRASAEGIVCRWPPSDHQDFASYALWRGDDGGRRVVFRTADRSQTSFLDRDVSRGASYVYFLEARDGRGNTIATGGPTRAQAT